MEHDQKAVVASYKNAIKNGASPLGVPRRAGIKTAFSVMCEELGLARTTARRMLLAGLGANPVPLSEDHNKFHAEWTPDDCIKELQRIANIDTNKVITRNYFRVHSDISESTWSRFFGSFAEFKRQAGVILSRHAHRLEKQIAKHASADRMRVLNEEKRDWEGNYSRPSSRRFQTVLVGADFHDKECDPFYRRMFLEAAKRAQPEQIVLNGDLFDLPEFSKFAQDPRSFNLLERIKWVHAFLHDLRAAAPDATLTLIEGNHECIQEDTEVLTTQGWVAAKYITQNHCVAQIDLKDNSILYAQPLAIAARESNLVSIQGNMHDELVSDNHHIVLDGKRTPIKYLIGTSISQDRFLYAADSKSKGVEISDNWIRILTWIVTDATLVRKSETQRRIQWKLSRQDKIDNLEALLQSEGIHYTKRKANFSTHNVLQPWYICIHGTKAREICGMLNDIKTYPQKWLNFNKNQVQIFIDTLHQTDGRVHFNHTILSTSKKEESEFLLRLFFNTGVPAKVTVKTQRKGAFKEGSTIYCLEIYEKGVYNRNYVSIKEAGRGNVIAIQMPHQTLVTRRNGKTVVTGNCRLLKHLAEATPALMVVLSDLHGFTVSKLLGLEQFEMNYIARSDLAAWSEKDITKELRKNYMMLYDKSLLFGHYPDMRNMGIPGASGHHHKHIVWSAYSPTYGPYEWHQTGCGHVREASYCAGEKWGNGFLLVHCDTHRKRSQFEYIDLSHEMCMMGGKFYQRLPEEIIHDQ